MRGVSLPASAYFLEHALVKWTACGLTVLQFRLGVPGCGLY